MNTRLLPLRVTLSPAAVKTQPEQESSQPFERRNAPSSRAGHLLPARPRSVRGALPAAGDGDSSTGVCHRCRRRSPQPPGAGRKCRGGDRRSRVTSGVPRTVEVPAHPRPATACRGTAGWAARVLRGCRCRRARQTLRGFGRAGRTLPVSWGAVEGLSAPRRCRASLLGRFSLSLAHCGHSCVHPRVECPRGRPRRAGACCTWANTRPGKHPEQAGAAVTEGPRRVMHGRRAAAR